MNHTLPSFLEYPAGVFYNELETRVRLSKRRKINSDINTAPSSRADAGRVRLVVKHRETNDEETQAQLERLEMLKHESELEEEAEDEEFEEGGGSVGSRSDKSSQERAASSGEEEDAQRSDSRDSSPPGKYPRNTF